MTPELTLWLNGEYLDASQRHTGGLAHALHYGTGVFEGIRAYDTEAGPAVFRFDEHLERMRQGAELLGMPLDVDQIKSVTMELLQRNQHRSAYVRPIAYYGAGGLKLDMDVLESHVLVATLPWKSHLGDTTQGVSLTASPFRRLSHKSLPPLKFTGIYVTSCIAKRDATKRGFDEALFIDDDGYVCEATGENVFIVKNGQVIAVEHPDALPGITRATIIEMSGAASRRVHVDELKDADEVFLTGTSAEVAPVSHLDGNPFTVGSVTLELQAAYQDIVHGRDQTFSHWLTTA